MKNEKEKRKKERTRTNKLLLHKDTNQTDKAKITPTKVDALCIDTGTGSCDPVIWTDVLD
jgi:hypothetical protein